MAINDDWVGIILVERRGERCFLTILKLSFAFNSTACKERDDFWVMAFTEFVSKFFDDGGQNGIYCS